MAQYARFEVGDAIKGIDNIAVLILGKGIDGKISPRQILLQRNFRGCINFKAFVSARDLALGPGQRVLFLALRMKENRKIFSYRAIAKPYHLVRRRPDDDVIMVCYRQAEYLVAYGAANQIGLHG